MKIIISILLLISIVSVALGSVSQSFKADPENPDNCLVKGKSYPPGVYKNPSETDCYRVTCHKGGHSQIARCGVQSYEKDGKECKTNGYIDVSLPYPECCDMNVICPAD